MKITIIGTGYVGLVTGACFAKMGNRVICVDIDQAKIKALQQGKVPIYEPGLAAIVKANLKNQQLHFTNQFLEALQAVDFIFLAVDTPLTPHGAADLTQIMTAAKTIGNHLQHPALVVTKSTVPVGATYQIRDVIQDNMACKGKNMPVVMVANPEFLKEGTAVQDFLHPDRIIIGTDCQQAQAKMQQLYAPLTCQGHPLLCMDIRSAELTKYAANAMLVTKISFINEMAQLCERVGAHIKQVQRGLGSDPRIGDQFINAGMGYGGSCFPKDINALINTAKANQYSFKIVAAAQQVNEDQKLILYHKISRYFKATGLKEKIVAIWGLAFKPHTDDVRSAPALAFIQKLLAAGCHIQAYDPEAMPNAQKILGTQIIYSKDAYDALKKADALAIVTEWPVFQSPNWDIIKKNMKNPVIFDGRNILNQQVANAHGCIYHGIGIPTLEK